MPMTLAPSEILETVKMLQLQNLDIRTITMGISLRGCRSDSLEQTRKKIFAAITSKAERLVRTGEDIEKEYGIPIINKRISVTPLAIIADGFGVEEMVELGCCLDEAARQCGVNFIGGYSALVHKGMTEGDLALIKSIPKTLTRTERVCASVNIGTTKAGINMEAVSLMGHIIKETAEMTADRDGSVVPGWWYSAMRLRIIPLWPELFTGWGSLRRLSISGLAVRG